MRAGPGVDIVCRAEELVERFGEQSFDLVVSSCTFEHILRWKTAVSNMKHVCAPGGLLGFIVPDQSPYHAYPNDYWRYQEDDIVAIFADCKLLQLDHLPGLYSVLCAKLRKPRAFIEHDLNDYRLHSVVTGRRVATLRKIDFFSVSFAHVIWRDVLKPGIIKLIFALRQHRGLEN